MVSEDKDQVRTELVESYRDFLKASDKSQESQSENALTLFFSFDISNSSEYKSREYRVWYNVIIKIFDEIKHLAEFGNDGCNLWRILGDEIVFVKRINNEAQLIKAVDRVHEILLSILKSLNDSTFFDSLFNSENSQGFMSDMSNILSLKAAAWITVIETTSDNEFSNNPYHTIRRIFRNSEMFQILEFLGNDMDAGFRLSKQVCSGHLVLSYELANMLFDTRNADIVSKLHIVTYKQLKGIWENHLYPIIWYYNETDNKFENTISYNELATNPLIKEYIRNKELLSKDEYVNELPPDFYRIDKQFFERISTDRHIGKKVEYLESCYQDENSYIPLVLPETPQLIIHVAVVCYTLNGSDAKLMILQKDKNNKQTWEFGCAKIEEGKNLITQTQEYYKRMFNIELSFDIDHHRSNEQPIPLAIYQTPKQHENGLGIICIGQITNHEEMKLNSEKYIDMKFVSKDEWEKTKKSYVNVVDDFEDTIYKAFEFIDQKRRKMI